MIEHRCFGPPGTGKTHWLARQIERAIDKYGADGVMVASFTKTAAVEISNRAKLDKESGVVGTLHAICWRLTGRKPIAEGNAQLWNARCDGKGLAGFKISGAGSIIDEPTWGQSTSASNGDGMLQQVNALRSRRIDAADWPAGILRFWQEWQAWKREAGMLDFQDVIEYPMLHNIPPPASIRVAFFDEVQDFTQLELELVRYWKDSLEYIVLVGDDDQCIYTFKGATPQAFLNPEIPDNHKIVLSQSYRVPRAVHAVAQRLIETVQAREPKDYKPRDHDGSVERANFHYRQAKQVVDAMEAEAQQGRTAMLIGACSFMLSDVVHELRARGLPFHNPFRRTRGDWNPLYSTGKGTRTIDRLLAFLLPSEPDFEGWTLEQAWLWVQHCRASDFLLRGGKGEIERLIDEGAGNLFASDFDGQIFKPGILAECWGAGWSEDLDWIQARLNSSNAQPWRYPCDVVRKQGKAALQAEPKIIVGTIHSVKGGEAETVFLMPDLSPDGMREWINPKKRDSIARLFYVGITRAKDRLVVMAPAGKHKVSLPI